MKRADSVPVPRGRQGGRPRVETPLERVSTRLPVPAYDRLVRLANLQETSVSNIVRQLLVFRLK